MFFDKPTGIKGNAGIDTTNNEHEISSNVACSLFSALFSSWEFGIFIWSSILPLAFSLGFGMSIPLMSCENAGEQIVNTATINSIFLIVYFSISNTPVINLIA